MTNQEIITLVYDSFKITTAMAHLVIFGDDQVWLPKSQVTNIDEKTKTLEIPLWLAIEKELEDFEY